MTPPMLNDPSSTGRRPSPLPLRLELFGAVMAKDLPALTALLDRPETRAELRLTGRHLRRTPLDWAMELMWCEGVQAMLHCGANPHGHDPAHPPLLVALRRGSWPVAKHLLDSGADLDSVDVRGNDALQTAAKHCVPMMAPLLALRADWPHVDRLNNDGFGPIGVLAARDEPDAIEALIRHGANVNAAQLRGFTPLHIAANNKSNRALAVLLAHGADASFESVQGATALSVALEHDNAAAVEALMDAGMDPRRGNSLGLSPADIAARRAGGAAEAVLRRAAALDLRDSLAAQLPEGPRPRPSPSL